MPVFAPKVGPSRASRDTPATRFERRLPQGAIASGLENHAPILTATELWHNPVAENNTHYGDAGTAVSPLQGRKNFRGFIQGIFVPKKGDYRLSDPLLVRCFP